MGRNPTLGAWRSRSSVRLGKLLGVDVRVEWTAAIMAAVVAWSLAGSVLPETAPGLPGAVDWIAGAGGALLLDLALLAHELAHATLARRHRLEVAGIRLWLLGGACELVDRPASARAQALITIAGPAATAAVSALALGLTVLLAYLGAPNVGIQVMGWLVTVNAALLIFNLIPVHPLDGGRLLGALLWRASGNRERGFRQAAWAGRALATALVAGGVLLLVGVSALAGAMTAATGGFLLAASFADSMAMRGWSGRLGGTKAHRMGPEPGPAALPGAYRSGTVRQAGVRDGAVRPWRG